MRFDDPLFSRYDLYSVLRSTEEALAKAVEQIPRKVLLESDLDALLEPLVKQFTLHVPQLMEDKKYGEQEEIDVDVSHDFRFMPPLDGRGARVKGFRVRLNVPFEGDEDLFKCKPSQHYLNHPHASAANGILTIERQVVAQDLASLKTEFDRELSEIRSWLQWIANDTRPHNEGLKARAEAAIEARRAKLRKAQDALVDFGFPLRNSASTPRTYAAPEVRRKPAPLLPTAAPAKPLEPTLSAELYEHMLRVIQGFAKTMERSPRPYETMEEEAIRDNILAFLNGHYDGLATGETFNVSGKTDILVRSHGKNIFVAECKFWGGREELSAAINQLQRYIGWRDTKAALIVFSRRKGFRAVLGKVHDTVIAHPTFKREVPSPLDEGTFRFIMKRANDADAEFMLTVLVFDVPSKT